MKPSHQLIDFLLFACRKKLGSFQYRQSAQMAKILDYKKNFVFLRSKKRGAKHRDHTYILKITQKKSHLIFWILAFTTKFQILFLFSSNRNGPKSVFLFSKQLVSWWEVFGGNHYRYHPRRRSVWINNGQLYSRYSSIYQTITVLRYHTRAAAFCRMGPLGAFTSSSLFYLFYKEIRDDDDVYLENLHFSVSCFLHR